MLKRTLLRVMMQCGLIVKLIGLIVKLRKKLEGTRIAIVCHGLLDIQ